MKKKPSVQNRDRLTGRKLYPIQVWVERDVHIELVNRADREGRPLKAMLRRELTQLARAPDFAE